MARLLKKIFLLIVLTSTTVSPTLHAFNFQSAIKSCEEKFNNSSVGKFTNNYALPLSLLAGTFVSGSCLIGTENFLGLIKNVVGAVPFCAYKVTEQLGPKKTLGATLAALVGLGLKHYYSFYKIENRLIVAETAKSYEDPNFMLTGWWLCYPTHTEIRVHKKELKNKLRKINDLDKKLQAEQQWLEESIHYVSQYTDLSAKLVAYAIANEPKNYTYAMSDSVDSEKALAILAQSVQQNTTFVGFETTEYDLKKECQGHSGSSICYLSQWRWWNPLAISFAPCMPKATQVCIHLFKAYVRVCAFQQLAHEIADEKAKKEKGTKEKLLERAKVNVSAHWPEIVN